MNESSNPKMNVTDQQLITETLEGNTKSFGVLVERYQDFVFTIIVRMVKVKEEAEEVAQDTFIKAFKSLVSFRGESKFSSWLYSIAYRKALDRIKKNNRHRTTEFLDETTETSFTTIENGLHYLEAKEKSQKINDCIMKLNEDEAAIITFYYFEEQSVREISAITNLTEDNIKVKLYRGRKKLFSLLQDYIRPELKQNGTDR